MGSLHDIKQPGIPIASLLPIFQIHYHDKNLHLVTVHQDEPYAKRFGWLTARYRQTRW